MEKNYLLHASQSFTNDQIKKFSKFSTRLDQIRKRKS